MQMSFSQTEMPIHPEKAGFLGFFVWFCFVFCLFLIFWKFQQISVLCVISIHSWDAHHLRLNLKGTWAKPERKPSTKMPLCFVVKSDFILLPSRPLERPVHLETEWGSHMTLCKQKLVSQTKHRDAICHEVWSFVRSRGCSGLWVLTTPWDLVTSDAALGLHRTLHSAK